MEVKGKNSKKTDDLSLAQQSQCCSKCCCKCDKCSENSAQSTTLIAIGDFEYELGNKFEIFDLPNQQWVEININCNKRNYNTILMGEDLLIIGGETPNSAVNTVEKYNLRSGQMVSFTPMKYARFQTSTVLHGGAVYVLGGFNGTAQVANVEKWDPVLRSWIDVASLTLARHGHEAVILGNEIIAVGGYNSGVSLNLTEAYNMDTNTWRTCAPLNDARYFLGLTALKGYLYAVGGIDTAPVHSVERYDPQIDKWTRIQSIEVGRHGLGAVIHQGRVTIAGGYYLGFRSNTVEVYDEEYNRWRPMASLKNGRFKLDLVQIPLSLMNMVLNRRA